MVQEHASSGANTAASQTTVLVLISFENYKKFKGFGRKPLIPIERIEFKLLKLRCAFPRFLFRLDIRSRFCIMRVSPPLPSPCPPAWRKNRRKSPATAPERVGQRFASGSASLPTNGDDAEHERQKAAQHVHEFAVYYKALVSECCEVWATGRAAAAAMGWVVWARTSFHADATHHPSTHPPLRMQSMDTFPDETMEWLQSEEGQRASKEQYEVRPLSCKRHHIDASHALRAAAKAGLVDS